MLGRGYVGFLRWIIFLACRLFPSHNQCMASRSRVISIVLLLGILAAILTAWNTRTVLPPAAAEGWIGRRLDKSGCLRQLVAGGYSLKTVPRFSDFKPRLGHHAHPFILAFSVR